MESKKIFSFAGRPGRELRIHAMGADNVDSQVALFCQAAPIGNWELGWEGRDDGLETGLVGLHRSLSWLAVPTWC